MPLLTNTGAGVPFTAFTSVTPETPLEHLNLNWREQDLPERERTRHVHRLHPYLGKFVPQLAELFLRKYRPAVVCDPFSGSGTTLVEATALGIDSVGCDVSPFNCLLARVKTGEYDIDTLRQEVESVLASVARYTGTVSGETAGMFQIENGADYLERWYAPQALETLLRYRAQLEGSRYQDVLSVILSRAARSVRRAAHHDLDFPREPVTGPYYCHKHRRMCQPASDALPFLRRYSADTLKRIAAFAAVRRPANVQVIQGDARVVEFPPCDLVVTSPPYVGLIDYHEQHRYAYALLGLPEQREQEIGPSWRGTSRAAVTLYLDSMAAVFARVARALPAGGRLVVVVHDRRGLYDGLDRRLGFTLETRLQREVNRRTGRRGREFFEDVLIWRV